MLGTFTAGNAGGYGATGLAGSHGSANGYSGGTGIYLNSSISSADGNITLTGTGGFGGTVSGLSAAAGTNANGADAFGGGGGNGIWTSSFSTIYSSGYNTTVSLKGTGGAGGGAAGGNGDGSGSGGYAGGGSGGYGISHQGQAGGLGTGAGGSATAPNVVFDGSGGTGGSGIGGNSGSGTGSYAGKGIGGYGGAGIQLRSSSRNFAITSSYGDVSITATGGTGGSGSDGAGGFGTAKVLAAIKGSTRTLGSGGHGLDATDYSGYGGTVSAGGVLSVSGSGGNGGTSTGTNATPGSGNLAGAADGGSGGTGVYVNGPITFSGNAVKLAVAGGVGGAATAGTGDGVTTSPGVATPGTNGPGFEFSYGGAVNAGTGTLTLTAFTPTSQISVGAGTSGGLGIVDSSLAAFTAGTLQIGDSTHSGPIVLDGNFDPALYMSGLQLLQLQTSGSVTDSGGPFAITAPELTVNTGTGITLAGANQTPLVTLINSTSGNVLYNSAVSGGLTVSGANLPGSFSITETAAGITVDTPGISANSVRLAAATGYGILLNGPITSSGLTLIGNNFDFNNSTVTTTGGGSVVVTNDTPATQILLDPTTITGASNLTGGGIQIGDSSNTGGILFDASINVSIPLFLVTSGGVTTSSTSSMTAPALTVNAGTGISLTGANVVPLVTLTNSSSGNVLYNSSVTGGLTVNGSNSATGGSFTVTEALGGLTVGGITTSSGAVSLSAAGNIGFTSPINAGTGSVSLTSGDAISGLKGSASITAGSAQLTALNGIGATSPFMTVVGQLGASNTNNAVQLANNGVLNVSGISNGGLVLLDNTGAMTLAGPVQSTGSTVTVTAHSPLTLNSGSNVLGNGTVTLFAGASGSPLDNLLVNGNVTSSNGDIILKAGNLVTVNGTLLAPNGKITIEDNLNSPVLTTQSAAQLPEVALLINNSVTTMGKEAGDMTDEEKEEIEETREGDRHGTEFRALPYCN